tara:strand:+ start:143 stop:538 length:396 start_codon:yes stop_codon:yes gene_type:complete
MLDFMDNNKYTMLAGRILLALIYFQGGFLLFSDMSGVVMYAASKNIPEILVTAAFALKLLAGLAIIIGFQTRLAALGLVIFTLCTAFIFHPYPDGVFMKELSMVGGLLLLLAVGPGEVSIDYLRKRNDRTL